MSYHGEFDGSCYEECPYLTIALNPGHAYAHNAFCSRYERILHPIYQGVTTPMGDVYHVRKAPKCDYTDLFVSGVKRIRKKEGYSAEGSTARWVIVPEGGRLSRYGGRDSGTG